MSDKIVESIAKKLGKEGAEYLEKHGELPAIQLTPEEMKFVNGGFTTEIAQAYKDILKRARSLF